VSSGYAKFNDISLLNACNFKEILPTDIISTVNNSDVCFTNKECVCIEDCSHSMDVQLCNLNLITASTNLSVENIVYSGIVSLNNAISYVGDVFTTACYLDKCMVFYDDCMFTTRLPGIATGSYIYDCVVSPCMALVSSKVKLGDNVPVGLLCRIIANCNNVSQIVYFSHVSQFKSRHRHTRDA
jgi:hypothetical protein